MYTDIMLDIETASTEYNAVILSIGAVCFSIGNTDLPSPAIELLIDKEDGDRLGLHTSEETLKWWNTQPKEVYSHAFIDGPRVSTKEALLGLNEFISTYPTIKQYWCQGINFDPVVLENAYKKCGLAPKWKFYQLRDSRTVQHLIPSLPFSKPKDAHTPVADCLYQIKVVQHVLRSLSAQPPRDDWTCVGCQSTNHSYRQECYKCFKDKHGNQTPVREDWICSGCNVKNFGYRKSCFKCKGKQKNDF